MKSFTVIFLFTRSMWRTAIQDVSSLQSGFAMTSVQSQWSTLREDSRSTASLPLWVSLSLFLCVCISYWRCSFFSRPDLRYYRRHVYGSGHHRLLHIYRVRSLEENPDRENVMSFTQGLPYLLFIPAKPLSLFTTQLENIVLWFIFISVHIKQTFPAFTTVNYQDFIWDVGDFSATFQESVFIRLVWKGPALFCSYEGLQGFLVHSCTWADRFKGTLKCVVLYEENHVTLELL